MTSVRDIVEAARRLSPVEQLEIIQNITQTLQRSYAETATTSPTSVASRERVIGLHQGQVWMSDDFNEELPDEFWFGDKREPTT